MMCRFRLAKARILTRHFSSMLPMAAQKQRFAPLNPDLPSGKLTPVLQGVVFDVDGTLCEPQTWMFAQMRAALGIPKTVDILAHIYTLAADKQPAAMESIREVERGAMREMVPQKGLIQLMEYLQKRGMRKAICTRNFDAPVDHLISNFCQGQIFSPIITREFQPPKPDPAGIYHIAKQWGLEDKGDRLIMVGDSLDDLTAGRRAGSATVLLVNDVNRRLVDHEYTDCVIERLDDLIEILDNGFPEIERTTIGS